MRIALVNNVFIDQLGYFYIAAVLKQAGHEVRFFTTSRRLMDEVRKFDPQLAGLTAVTGNHQWAAGMAAELKDAVPGLRTILGGPHPTYYPQIIEDPGLDFICRGEGERPIVNLAEALEKGDEHTKIKGIWAKDGDRIFENPFEEYIEDLDTIPFPDRAMYDQWFLTRKNIFPMMLSSRGCPFHCTFCYAPTLSNLTKEKGKFVRFRSVDNLIQEALALKERYPVRSVEFVDDIFGMSRPWLREFSERWKKEVKIQYQCSLRADLVNEETSALLADSGCKMIAFGLESGNERVRNEILQKEVSTEQIHLACDLLKKHRIRIMTYNILGSPTETFEDTLDTLKLNQEIRPDYAWTSIMQPYPQTKIYDIAVENEAFASDADAIDSIDSSYFRVSELDIPHRREIVNLQKLFNVAVRFPRLTPLVRRLIKLPENSLFYLVFLSSHAWYLLRFKRMPSVFMLHIFLNAGELWRRHESKLYKRRLPRRPDAPPSMKQRIETGAIG